MLEHLEAEAADGIQQKVQNAQHSGQIFPFSSPRFALTQKKIILEIALL